MLACIGCKQKKLKVIFKSLSYRNRTDSFIVRRTKSQVPELREDWTR